MLVPTEAAFPQSCRVSLLCPLYPGTSLLKLSLPLLRLPTPYIPTQQRSMLCYGPCYQIWRKKKKGIPEQWPSGWDPVLSLLWGPQIQ